MRTILVACEESQEVTSAFRELGYEAYSCDTEPCSGGREDWHFQCSVLDILDEHWDMLIAFPPCTHLASSGAKWFEQKRADGRQQEGIDFFMEFVKAPIRYKAIENPVGIMSTEFRKPDQIVQPYMFGDSFTKRTCLWLFNLPKLEPTDIVDPGAIQVLSSGKKIPEWYSNAKHKDRAKIRSKTFPGLARAMAEQWGKMLDK